MWRIAKGADMVISIVTVCPLAILSNAEGSTCTNGCRSAGTRTTTFLRFRGTVKETGSVWLSPGAIEVVTEGGVQVMAAAAGYAVNRDTERMRKPEARTKDRGGSGRIFCK